MLIFDRIQSRDSKLEIPFKINLNRTKEEKIVNRKFYLNPTHLNPKPTWNEDIQSHAISKVKKKKVNPYFNKIMEARKISTQNQSEAETLKFNPKSCSQEQSGYLTRLKINSNPDFIPFL